MEHLESVYLGTALQASNVAKAVMEAMVAIFGRPLMEANAGDVVKRCVKVLMREYGVESPETARAMCLDLRHAVFDQFSTGQVADASKDPGVVKFLGMFEPVIRLLCEQAGLVESGEGYLDIMSQFGRHFKAFVAQHGSDIGVNVTVTDTKNKQNRKDLTLSGAPVSYSEIMKVQPISQDSLGQGVVPTHRYKKFYVPDHDFSVQHFQGKVPWCLTWDEDTYWNQYSNKWINKCYFLFRDDFDTVENTPHSSHDPTNDYAISALGMFVAPDGTIAHIYNRDNSFDHMYSEDDIARLVGHPFSEVFPPYTKEEIEKRTEDYNNSAPGAEKRPVTCDNFFEQYNDMYTYQRDHDQWEGEEAIIGDLAESVCTIGYDDGSGLEMYSVTIIDTSDNQPYTMIIVQGDGHWDYYPSDALTKCTEWIPGNLAAKSYGYDILGGLFRGSGILIAFNGQVCLLIDDAWDCKWHDIPEGYDPYEDEDVFIPNHPIDDDESGEMIYPIAIFVTNRGTGNMNILIMPSDRWGEPHMFFAEDRPMANLSMENDGVSFTSNDETDIFNDPENGGLALRIPFSLVKEKYEAGSDPEDSDE